MRDPEYEIRLILGTTGDILRGLEIRQHSRDVDNTAQQTNKDYMNANRKFVKHS